MQMQNILVLGGSGFVGSHLVSRLSSKCARIVVPSRHRARHKTICTVPGVELVQADINEEGTLLQLCAGKDAVINLVGILHDREAKLPYGRAFQNAHVDLPRRIIDACMQHGVRRLLHMSALNSGAMDNGEQVSRYLASKGDGEALVHEADRLGNLDVTIFRPSVIYGQGDLFLHTFAKLALKYPGFLPTEMRLLPLPCAHARFMPVWVADVADAFVHSLTDRSTFGVSYDLAGPDIYTLKQLVEYAAQQVEAPVRVLALSERLGRLQATLLSLLPRPLLSPDNLRSMSVDSVLDANANLPPGWQPQSMRSVAPALLQQHDHNQYYALWRHQARR